MTAPKSNKAMQFALGGGAGMLATCVVQPVDLIKTRMQLSGEGGAAKVHKTSLHAAVNIIKQEGIVNLYTGLSAGLLRQATYTTARLGMYTSLSERFATSSGALPFYKKALIGMTAGGFGAVIGTPAEVALIRMTSDGRLPVDQRRNYKHAFDALARISREEGVLTMWRGCTPTVVRAMVLNATQLAVYSQAKEVLLRTSHFEEGLGTHIVASTISGFFSTCVSMPVDIAKTRIQTMKTAKGATPEYSGFTDVIIKTVKREGVFSLWKGFTPYFFRLGPHTILTFIFLEQLKNFFGGGGRL